MGYRLQPGRASFNCEDLSEFMADCQLKDRARKPILQQVKFVPTPVEIGRLTLMAPTM